MDNKTIRKYRLGIVFVLFLIIEVFLFTILFSFFSTPVFGSANQTVTVPTYLTVGNVPPEIFALNITDGSGVNVTLTPASYKIVYCNGIARDFNNDTDIANITAEFYYKATSFYGDTNDNNTHYSNLSCAINYNATNPGYGDDATGNFTANFSCSFQVQYYANPGAWNCTAYAYDSMNWNGTNTTSGNISTLIAISLPDSINYGTVNATAVSEENVTNVTNVGNVPINLSLSGYAQFVNDSNAMNCTKGTLRNISIGYEKYNLTDTTSAVTSLSDFESKYLNLTSNASTIRKFSLNFRQNEEFNEATNKTYWRIYVPRGVAGTCSGNIVFAGSTASAN